jgi:hypothetical protein
MMLDRGYRPLAIHSPWSLAIQPAGAGKQPLTEVVDGRKQPWTLGHSHDRLMRVTPLSANTGLLLGGSAALIALDLDPRKDAGDEAQWAFTSDVLCLLRDDRLWPELQRAPMRLREPASVLFLLRAGKVMSKIKVAGERGAVEMLGEGQQVVVDGYHPRSLGGQPVRWVWRNERFPWTVPAAELPVVSAADIEALMERIGASGVLGAPVLRASITTVVASRSRPSAYDATGRLRALLEKHEGLIRPAIREVVEQIGGEGGGRHDALVSIAGRLVLQGWSDQSAIEFLAPIVNDAFGEGDWTDEILGALGHARKRETERMQKKGPATWH